MAVIEDTAKPEAAGAMPAASATVVVVTTAPLRPSMVTASPPFGEAMPIRPSRRLTAMAPT
jgi:hypothetical protein